MSAANEAAAHHADAFSVTAVVALVGVGIVAFCAFLLAAAYVPDPARDWGGGGTALSDSAIGFAGMVDLLKGVGTPVSIRRTDPAKARDLLLVLTPSASERSIPRQLVDDAASITLVVLPKWTVESDNRHAGWVVRRGLLDMSAIAATLPFPMSLYRRDGIQQMALHGGDGVLSRIEPLALAPVRDLQLIDPAAGGWSPALLTNTGETVLARATRAHGQPVYVLSDPDLLNTQGLKTLEGAQAALAIVDGLRADAPVAFDVTLNGFARSPNLLRLLFEPPLLAATLCAAAAGLLILALAVRRFGPVIEPPRVHDFGKRALADNAAALIGLAGREPRMITPYADLIRAQILHAVGAPPRSGRAMQDRLIEAAGRARGRSAETFRDFAREADGVASRPEALAVAVRLFAWSKDLRRGHR